jgi:hypothetical protein
MIVNSKASHSCPKLTRPFIADLYSLGLAPAERLSLCQRLADHISRRSSMKSKSVHSHKESDVT